MRGGGGGRDGGGGERDPGVRGRTGGQCVRACGVFEPGSGEQGLGQRVLQQRVCSDALQGCVHGVLCRQRTELHDGDVRTKTKRIIIQTKASDDEHLNHGSANWSHFVL